MTTPPEDEICQECGCDPADPDYPDCLCDCHDVFDDEDQPDNQI